MAELPSGLVDVVKLTDRPTLALALENYIAHCTANGTIYKISVQGFIDYIAPKISALGASGYVVVEGNELPTPSNPIAYSIVFGPQIYTHSAGNVNATGAINIISFSSGVWSLTKSIDIDFDDYAKQEDLEKIKSKTDLLNFDNSDGVFYVSDANGNVGFKVTERGVEANDFYNGRGNKITGEEINNGDKRVVAVDSNGSVGFEITEKGKVKAININKSFVPFVSGRPSDYDVQDSYGQSLSIGEEGTPPVSVTQKYDSLMIQRGPRIEDGFVNGLVPLVENTSSAPNRGETPLSGLSEKFIETISNKSFLDSQNKGFVTIGMATGVGAKSIQELSKGHPDNLYSLGINNLKGIKLIASSEGKSVAVNCSTWIQGEGNIENGTTTQQYFDLAKQLFNDRNNDYKSITGQKNNMIFVGYQIAWYGGNSTISDAHLKMHNELSNFAIAVPAYIFKYVRPNDIHMNAASYRMMGAYMGLAKYKMLVEGNKKTIVKPIDYSVTGNTIVLLMDVPRLPLKIDTVQVPSVKGNGFRFFDAGNVEQNISSLRVEFDKVYISLLVNPSGGTLTYGTMADHSFHVDNGDGTIFLPNRGNLRDSQGDDITFDNKRMDNWTARFTINL